MLNGYCPIHTTGGMSHGEKFFSTAEPPPGLPISSELFTLQADGH